ncbi:MAG: hypothetical protein HQK87_04420 [Nitrospinae bacterium]|nr:hypothetical protein [Nitrospinota bacterium]
MVATISGARFAVAVALVGGWLALTGCEKKGESDGLSVPAVDLSGAKGIISEECATVMKRNTEAKMAMQEELKAALEAKDMPTLERLNEITTALSKEIVDACGE